MQTRCADFTGRLPEELHRDALDLSLVFNQSLSEYLSRAIAAYVDAQLARRVVSTAVDKVREARGLRSGERRPRATSQRPFSGRESGPEEPSKGDSE